MFLTISVMLNMLAFLFIKYLINSHDVTFTLPFTWNLFMVYAYYSGPDTSGVWCAITLLVIQVVLFVLFGIMEYYKSCGNGWHDSNEKYSLLEDIKATMFVYVFILLGLLVAPLIIPAFILVVALIVAVSLWDGLRAFKIHVIKRYKQ